MDMDGYLSFYEGVKIRSSKNGYITEAQKGVIEKKAKIRYVDPAAR